MSCNNEKQEIPNAETVQWLVASRDAPNMVGPFNTDRQTKSKAEKTRELFSHYHGDYRCREIDCGLDVGKEIFD